VIRLVHPLIPMAERELNVTFVEQGTTWGVAAPIERLLGVVETLELAQASVDFGQTWSAYDRGAAVAAVLHGVDGVTAITARSADGAVHVTVARPPVNKNTVSVTFDAQQVARRGVADIERMIATVVGALPDLSIAIATAAHQTDFPVLFDELPSPPPFLQSAWLHVVPARTFDPAKLLGAPVRVEAHDDGNVWMYTYPDPMHYDTEAAVAAMRALSRYLRSTP
jgi:hypothetical protein